HYLVITVVHRYTLFPYTTLFRSRRADLSLRLVLPTRLPGDGAAGEQYRGRADAGDRADQFPPPRTGRGVVRCCTRSHGRHYGTVRGAVLGGEVACCESALRSSIARFPRGHPVIGDLSWGEWIGIVLGGWPWPPLCGARTPCGANRWRPSCPGPAWCSGST